MQCLVQVEDLINYLILNKQNKLQGEIDIRKTEQYNIKVRSDITSRLAMYCQHID